jgi:hypothetical protein
LLIRYKQVFKIKIVLPSPVPPAMRDPRRMMRPGLEDMVGQVPREMENTGGFDASDLMKDPEMAQQSTRDQAEKVSEPYRQANMMAADKNNPMNAVSQDPGRAQLQDFINRKLRDPRRRGDGSGDMAGM